MILSSKLNQICLGRKNRRIHEAKKIQTNSKGKDENQIINFFNEEEDLKEFFFYKSWSQHSHKLKMF